jgi:predicted DNA binding CopG/RHH family protein
VDFNPAQLTRYSMTKPTNKVLSTFANEQEERAFWESQENVDFVDWTHAKNVRLLNSKPTTKAISIRLPVDMIEKLKVAANKKDVPYQLLVKIWIDEKLV